MCELLISESRNIKPMKSPQAKANPVAPQSTWLLKFFSKNSIPMSLTTMRLASSLFNFSWGDAPTKGKTGRKFERSLPKNKFASRKRNCLPTGIQVLQILSTDFLRLIPLSVWGKVESRS